MTDYPLPPSSDVAVDRLAGAFDQVTNSYKFFWFLSLLEHVKLYQSRTIPVVDLLAQMVALVWYPSSYYRLYFGKQDQLRNVAEQIQQVTGLPADAKTMRVRDEARATVTNRALSGRGLLLLGDYVPYRFARPFVADETRNLPDQKVNAAVRVALDARFEADPAAVPYRFVGPDAIELSPPWHRYLTRHNEVLTGFCLWHLTKYLQGHNPNVTNIPAKLFPPAARDMKQARRFWDTALKVRGGMSCIYSGQPLMAGTSFSLDHFLPWRYVAHDLTWNLIPTPKEVNSSKSDSLPDTHYFDGFARLQYDGVRAVLSAGRSSLLEDHVLLLRLDDERQLATLPYDEFRKNLQDVMLPQFQIARNMGFRTNWRYQ